jgi:hypothetical protein
MFPQGVSHQSRTVLPGALRGLVGGAQQLFIQHDLNDLHMWNLFHSILHIEGHSKSSCYIPEVGGRGRPALH